MRPMHCLLFAATLVVGAAAAPAGAQTATSRTVELQVSDTMRFTPAQIAARPGERLRVVVKSVGTMPKQAMAHNFVLLRKGADPKAFVEKSATARETDFIAPGLRSEVLAATSLVGPGETTEITFTVPSRPGDYTFLCSFPGHFLVGMRGTLVVK